MARARLLFVCVENSCRSQMAEGFARRLGGEAVDVHPPTPNSLGLTIQSRSVYRG
ncbi:MAG: hypothetical protein IIC73_00845 [Armatimonadetes bacterium]|nr:hypothetical protein [Armatimonadota bacterium]